MGTGQMGARYLEDGVEGTVREGRRATGNLRIALRPPAPMATRGRLVGVEGGQQAHAISQLSAPLHSK